MKKKRSKSIKIQLLGPLLVLLVLQAAAIGGTVLFGGVSIKLKSYDIHVLNRNTANKKNTLEKETVQQWAGILNDAGFVTDEIQTILKQDKRIPQDISEDYRLNAKIIEKILGDSIELLEGGHATGVFMVLNGPAAKNSPKEMKAGFYLRNSKSGGYIKENSSFLMERGMPSLAKKYGIGLDSFWELGFLENVEGEEDNWSFYNKPYQTAILNRAAKEDTIKFAYLSPPFRLSPKDISVITYAIPIILNDGTVVGTYGLEMTVSALEQYLENEQANGSFNVCWLLGIREKGSQTITPVVTSGSLYNQYFTKSNLITYQYNVGENINELKSFDGTKWYASIEKLEYFENDDPLENKEWVLTGITRKKDLLSSYNAIRSMIFSSMLEPIGFSLLGALVIGRMVSGPIERLVKEMRGKSGSRGLALNRVHIKEIDELTETIEQLNRDVEMASSKISCILEYANVPIGVFEYESGTNRVFCSRSLFEMLGWGELEEPYCYIKLNEFLTYMEKTFSGVKVKGDRVLQYLEGPNGVRWVEFIMDNSKKGTVLGVCSDVTAEVEEKEKLEKERNYDLLTDLYNRRAFREQVEASMRRQANKISAVIMWDLDNLKFINDTYGHDEGDRYISLFADCLKRFMENGGIVSRYSGDEFVIYLIGNEKEEIREQIRKFMKYIQTVTLRMEGGYEFPIRVSGGLAWYPEDTSTFETLLNYADFAMYMVKHSVKGVIKEFDSNEYLNNSYMLAGSEELNRMLDTRDVRFAYQPIVTRDGRVYGYELLMRPELENIKGISEVLNLVRAQAKLPQMESLTWFAGLKAAMEEAKLNRFEKEEKLFINSIASVCISDEDRLELEEKYGELLHRVVIEMTESEPASQNFLQRKIEMAKAWGGMIAIDDYGAGYNGEAILLHIRPDIVKMDKSLVKRIHKDPNRQIILKNILDFAEKNNIHVLAEGVEEAEELEFLMQSGVFLFQGYYIARPQMEIRPLDPYIVKKIREFSGKT